MTDSSGTHKSKFERTPPGQVLTTKWPVLHYGNLPQIDLTTWRFELFGLVEEPVSLTHEEFRSLPHSTVHCDIHCVTRWSRLDNEFEGVLARDVLNLVTLKPQARYAMLHAVGGWTTNLPLADLLREDVIFAWRWHGEEIPLEHGWPLRLVVPHLYFWKSAKWCNGIELMAEDRPGFWERNGYHRRGDPWAQERFSED